MKFFTKKSVIQKIMLVLIVLILVNFIVAPYKSYAFDPVGNLLKELVQMTASLGDIIMGAMNRFMLGANDGLLGIGSALLEKDDANLESEDSWLYVTDEERVIPNADDTESNVIEFGTNEEGDEEINTAEFFTGFREAKYGIPNMLYSPENIFANNIAALDINFLNPNNYTSVISNNVDAENASNSAALTLQKTISGWYKSFRNIAIVGLLSVLIYLGIRILISSTAVDKAKYKESIRDWLVALCLVFVINFIMSGILMITQQVNNLFAKEANEYIVVNHDKDGNDVWFRTNLMGLIRFQAQSSDTMEAVTYTILYAALILYTIIFTVIYFKRFLYMAFFTMIAPLVALTYPIDKAGDGKAQAFNMWFKEYTMNAVIQPVHLILYTVFVGSAANLVKTNPVYALVAIAFLIPAEKFIKRMFRLDKAETPGGFGSFAGGALTMNAMNKLASGGSSGKSSKSGNGESKNGNDNDENAHIFQRTDKGKLERFQSDNNDELEENSRTASDYPANPNGNNLNENNSNGNNLDGNNPSDSDEENEPEYPNNFQPINDEHRRLLDERKIWNDVANEEGSTPSNTNDALKERNEIDDEMQEKGYYNPYTKPLANQQNNEEQSQNGTERINANQTNVNGRPQPRDKYRRRIAGRALKTAGRKIWKSKGKIARTALSVAGAGVGATVGLAAGIASGDMSKAFTYMGAGAMAGRGIGRKAQSMGAGLIEGTKQIGTSTQGLIGDARRTINEEKYGYAYAQEEEDKRQNSKSRKSFMKDEKEIRKARDLMADMNYNGDIKNVMNAIADYKEAGITDDKLIHSAMKAEKRLDKGTNFDGSHHRDFVAASAFADKNGIGKNDIVDEKKRKTLETSVENNVRREDDRSKVMGYISDIFDARNTYDEKGKYGKTQMEARRQSRNTSTQGTSNSRNTSTQGASNSRSTSTQSASNSRSTSTRGTSNNRRTSNNNS